jgi:glycosyltransferase involved in cell wall biosynthesis
MHILLIHQSFASLNEPGGTRHYEMALYFTEQGHRVTIVASPVSYLTGISSATGTIVNGQVTIIRAYTYPALHRSFFHRLVSFFSFMASSFLVGLRVRDVDVVWGTSPPIFQGVTAWMLARLKGAPFLFEVRDLWPAFAVQVGVLHQPALVHASEWLERFLYRHSDRVVVNSPGFLDHVCARGARQVEVVPNGSDPHMFTPRTNGSNFRRLHGLQGKFLVVYAGAHGISNDLGTLLEAACMLETQPEIHFVLVGDGKEKPDLIVEATRRGLTNVSFLPSVPKNDMPQVLAAADACVAILKPLPLYATVYPNKVFDYMAAGKPVLLAIEGVIRQVVEAAGAGIAIPPGDPHALAQAVRHLASDPQAGREMGLHGRSYVEAHFDRSVIAAKMLEQFQELAVKV